MTVIIVDPWVVTMGRRKASPPYHLPKQQNRWTTEPLLLLSPAGSNKISSSIAGIARGRESNTQQDEQLFLQEVWAGERGVSTFPYQGPPLGRRCHATYYLARDGMERGSFFLSLCLPLLALTTGKRMNAATATLSLPLPIPPWQEDEYPASAMLPVLPTTHPGKGRNGIVDSLLLISSIPLKSSPPDIHPGPPRHSSHQSYANLTMDDGGTGNFSEFPTWLVVV